MKNEEKKEQKGEKLGTGNRSDPFIIKNLLFIRSEKRILFVVLL